MSIIIKGLNIPKCSNEDIMVVIRRDKAEVWQTGYKERTVEAIQIPTPHGRLIDESKMEFYYMERWTYTEDGIIKDRTRHYRDEDVLKTPTILEAEK